MFPSIQSISPCTILYSLTPKTASIQQFKLLQLLLKEEPQKKDQQLKRNKKGRWGGGGNTDHGCSSTQNSRVKQTWKRHQSDSKRTTWQKLNKIFMIAFYEFKLTSTSIEILIIHKPQSFWHTFKIHILSESLESFFR